MISPSCDLHEFLKAVHDADVRGLILAADAEATEAERLIYRGKKKQAGPGGSHVQEYASKLKALIAFVRYGIRTSSLTLSDLDGLPHPHPM